ncbi:hypothetical protein OIU92_13335 [Escherichia coli]|nr:hypothetical protein [Escherichia coli]
MMGNMAPFILRGVTLKGIDSVMFAKEKEQQSGNRRYSICQSPEWIVSLPFIRSVTPSLWLKNF